MLASVVFRVLEEDATGNLVGQPFVWDPEERWRGATVLRPTLPLMTLVEAEGYARTMRYDFVVIAEADATGA